jgi:GAF domain-containing protein
MDRERTDRLDDLRQRLHELHFTTEGLDRFLEELTVLAADVVDGDTSGGVTVIRDERTATVAASDKRTQKLDDIQYGNGDGPCLECARSGEPIAVRELTDDERWPKFREQALDHGMRSSLSLPLELGSEADGALNLYVFERHAFDEAERAVLSQFCDEASRAISLALRHNELSQQNDHLHTAMASRRLIDQAIGIIMAQNRCSADDAFGILRQASQNRNIKVRDLAATIIRNISGNEPTSEIHFKP